MEVRLSGPQVTTEGAVGFFSVKYTDRICHGSGGQPEKVRGFTYWTRRIEGCNSRSRCPLYSSSFSMARRISFSMSST